MATVPLRLVSPGSEQSSEEHAAEPHLDAVFAALSDPVRRAILTHLEAGALTVSELAEPFAISLQAISRHIQVLVRAGLIQQERTGRISRCSLLAGPIYDAAVWLNHYSKYWQEQFEFMAAALEEIDGRRPPKSLVKSLVMSPRKNSRGKTRKTRARRGKVS
jgi:DNA-binding transcriptional ArsR family regulator